MLICKLCRKKRGRVDDEESSIGARYKVEEERAVIVSEVTVPAESPNNYGMMG